MSFYTTYRLQLNQEFDFAQVAHSLEFLAEMGVGAIYLSPIFKATPGSSHGYDVTNPTQINPELNQQVSFETLANNCKQLGIKIILDIVPNHMATHNCNEWWIDVVTLGRDSEYAEVFDIYWDQVAENGGKLFLPVLGDEPADMQQFPKPQQNYQLGHWKLSLEKLHYRRFFDITGLIGICVEKSRVLERTHKLIFEILQKKLIQGIRIDHIDGLRNPTSYLENLVSRIPKSLVLVEKILEGEEQLLSHWPVNGTTGYEFMNWVTDLFVWPEGEQQLIQTFLNINSKRDPRQWLFETKLEIILKLFRPEFHNLGRILNLLSPENFQRIDDLKLLTAGLEVYRTYLPDQRVLSLSKEILTQASLNVLRCCPEDQELSHRMDWWIDFFTNSEMNDEEKRFVGRWQQLSGAVMAKGYEDTFLYRYYPLAARNEVGSMVVIPVSDARKKFYSAMSKVPKQGMNATSTHDNKRGEDTRARMLVISECVGEWQKWFEEFKMDLASFKLPETTLWLLGQTLFGTYPIGEVNLNNYQNRIIAYMLKACREGKEFTSWLESNKEFEFDLEKGIEHFLRPNCNSHQLLQQFVSDHLWFGRMNSIGQLLLKSFFPGIADFYQGSEFWHDSLMDPDNRFRWNDQRMGMMQKNGFQNIQKYYSKWELGELKFIITRMCMKLRKELRTDFLLAQHQELNFVGEKSKHLVGYHLQTDKWQIMVIVGRWIKKIGVKPDEYSGAIWKETALEFQPQGEWQDYLHGQKIESMELSQILSSAPFALLIKQHF